MKKERIPRPKVKGDTRQEVLDRPWGGHGRPPRDAEAVKADLDDVLAEIDDLLEENAEEFVKGYVQKGGQ